MLVSARFEGAGHFRVVRTPVLPVSPPEDGGDLPISPYTDPLHLAAVLVREYLYVALHQSLLDALAAEHGKRLVVAEGARSWLEEQSDAARRQLAAVRRESATQEVLEVVAGARSLPGSAARPGRT